ncbi:MAG: thioredoxin family protein [Ferruginibacter sp.]|nr:thioredoxin family protein [Ferruginibacter sp.]
MRNLSIFIASLAAISIMAFTISEPLPIGGQLPKGDVKMKDISGKEITVKELKKKNGILVMFSCNTCPYVIKNQQRTNAICSYAQKMELGVIVLNSNAANRNGEDSYASMKEYAKEQQYNWTYAVDQNSELADAFGANRTPECFLFDKDLRLVYHGAIDNNPTDEGNVTRRHLQVAIDEIAAGKGVSVKETKSVGCGIKRIKS